MSVNPVVNTPINSNEQFNKEASSSSGLSHYMSWPSIPSIRLSARTWNVLIGGYSYLKGVVNPYNWTNGVGSPVKLDLLKTNSQQKVGPNKYLNFKYAKSSYEYEGVIVLYGTQLVLIKKNLNINEFQFDQKVIAFTTIGGVPLAMTEDAKLYFVYINQPPVLMHDQIKGLNLTSEGLTFLDFSFTDFVKPINSINVSAPSVVDFDTTHINALAVAHELDLCAFNSNTVISKTLSSDNKDSPITAMTSRNNQFVIGNSTGGIRIFDNQLNETSFYTDENYSPTRIAPMYDFASLNDKLVSLSKNHCISEWNADGTRKDYGSFEQTGCPRFMDVLNEHIIVFGDKGFSTLDDEGNVKPILQDNVSAKGLSHVDNTAFLFFEHNNYSYVRTVEFTD
ncbi:MAG: hypothetical protein JHC93_07405 [Parachlamydiales bacterium]|nr:hypothetical protein [Parachlamydiales bacterium]